MFLRIIIPILLLLLSCKQQPESDPGNQLGKISLSYSGNAEAMPVFREGMLLLHSFEYKDAEEKFREAQSLDPAFAMAYWGEAMCKNHPLWREQNLREAREIIEKLGDTKEQQRSQFKTELEKDLFDALSILYGSGSKVERDKAYSEYMALLHEKYPDNHEITAFYALSILGAVKGGRDFEAYGKAARIAKSIIDENPNHPGALHYLIHSYDDPENAHKALDAANTYSKIAPDAGHALHMPSHIYVALGMWDEVIASNIDSWEASKNRKLRKNLDNDALNYHAFKWLMYAYLQKGDYASARILVKEMQGYAYEKTSERSAAHLVMMKAYYFIESGLRQDSLLGDTIDYRRFAFQTRAAHYFLEGYASYKLGNAINLNSYADSLSVLVSHSQNDALMGDSPMCSGNYSWEKPTQLNLDRATVMQLELEALSKMLAGEQEAAETFLIQAVDLEQKTSYNYGPPEIIKPSSELYAEWLIDQGRLEEAEEQLKLVLERAPGRYIVEKQLSGIRKAS
jgi:hypothetical protein